MKRQMKGCLKRVAVFLLAVMMVGTSINVSGLTVHAQTAERSLVCDVAEHTHDDGCYNQELTCGLEESDAHAHVEECYESMLVCDVAEHAHDDSCYQAEPVEEELHVEEEPASVEEEPASAEEEPASVEEEPVSAEEEPASECSCNTETEVHVEGCPLYVEVGEKVIGAWSWVGFETDTLAMSGLSTEKTVLKADIINSLPTSITAVINGTEEVITLGGWECEAYPETGAYEGTYTFAASLPNGFILGEGAKALCIDAELVQDELLGTPEEEIVFLATDYIDWNDGVPSVNKNASYSENDIGGSFAGLSISFAYRVGESGELTYVSSWDDITITLNGEDAKGNITYTAYDSGLYNLLFDQCGDYIFTYGGDSIIVHVGYPQVGFYNSTTKSIGTYIGEFNFHSMENDDNVFYIILDAPDDRKTTLNNETPFSVYSHENGEVAPEGWNQYFSYEQVGEETGVYKVTVNTEAGFNFNVNAVCTNNEDAEDYWDTSNEIGVWYSMVVEGLVVKDWIVEDSEGNLIIHQDAEFRKEAGATLSGATLYFAYLENEEDETPEILSPENLTITFEGGDASQYVTMSVNESNEELIDFNFTKTGDYTVSYNGSELVLYVGYPEIGFYSTESQSDETFIREFNFHSMENNDNVFYIILDAPDGRKTTLNNETPFSVYSHENGKVAPEGWNQYFSYEQVGEETGVYKVTVNTEAGFDFNVNAVCTNNENAEDSWDTSYGLGVWYSMVVEGLVVKDWVVEKDGKLVIHEDAEFMKEIGASLNGTTCYFAYLDSEDDETPEPVSKEKLTVTLNGKDAAECVTISVNESNAELIDFKFKETGDYIVSHKDNGSSVVIHVDFPVLGFYKTPELSIDGHIGEIFEYTTGSNDVVYLVVNKGDANVTEISVDHWYYDGCIKSEFVSDKNGLIIYKISILDELDSKFIVYATCQCQYGEEKPYEEYAEVVIQSTQMTGRKAYTDGEKHLGYTGCYMTKEEYEAGTIFWENSSPIFWVHADSVQGVIDKLSAVANGEEILYKKVDFAGPDTSDGTGDMEITNTGYIYVTISQIGNIDLQDQYVSSSGNMKGIYFTSGKDSAYSEHDYENGFYIEDCVFNLDNVKARITADGRDVNDVIPQDLQGKSYVSRYKGKAYHVTKVTNGDQHYFTLNNAVTFASGEESKETQLLQYLDLNNKEGIAEMTPFFKYPEMHVNIYCDMKFAGRYEKLSIGFKEGKNYTATIVNLLNGETVDTYTMDDLGGAKTKEVNTTFVYDGEYGNIVNEDTSVWLYEIDSETVTSGNYDGEVKIKETPEPNAMAELTQAQKDAIELGKKLTVDVKTDEKDAKDIDSHVAQKVKEAIKGNSYSGIVYLDLNVSATVDGVENNGKIIQTSITELKAPMDLTVDIPEHALKSGRKYRLVRHHKGKDGKEHTEIIEGMLSNDRKKISFKTDKFSTYAIVCEDVGGSFDVVNPPENDLPANLENNDSQLIDSVLTPAEKTAMQNGTPVSVYLKVDDINATVSKTDKNLIAGAKGNAIVGLYLDIDLFKDVNGKETQIKKTDGAVTISLTLPSSLINIKPEVTRTYKVVRVHEGVAKVLPTTFANGKISFKTDGFSTYAIVYTDTRKNGGGSWPFKDVAQSGWKYTGVKYVYDSGLMKGVGDGTRFDPDAPVTREMFATVLYRMAGEPAVTYKNKFPDVPGGKWYSQAVIWASEQGIVCGYADGNFGTGDYITREQMAKMLMEYAKLRGHETDVRADLSKFADRSTVSGWASEYMKWAVGCGMINGSTANGNYYLKPKGQATRAECATMLSRFVPIYG